MKAVSRLLHSNVDTLGYFIHRNNQSNFENANNNMDKKTENNCSATRRTVKSTRLALNSWSFEKDLKKKKYTQTMANKYIFKFNVSVDSSLRFE